MQRALDRVVERLEAERKDRDVISKLKTRVVDPTVCSGGFLLACAD